MRRIVYKAMLGLPARAISGVSTVVGGAGAIWPEKVKTLVGLGMTTDHIRWLGVALCVGAIFYFALLWLLKPGEQAALPSSTQTTHGDQSPAIGSVGGNVTYNNYGSNATAVQPLKSPYGSYNLDKLNAGLERVLRGSHGSDFSQPRKEPFSASDSWVQQGIAADIERQTLDRKAKWDEARQVVAWIPLCEALRYLVYETKWASSQSAVKDKDDFERRVSAEFLEHLARGDIEARGKSGWAAESLDRVTENIDRDFWVAAFIQPYGEIVLAAPDSQGTAGSKGSDLCYRSVIVRKQQVEAVWSPRDTSCGELTTLAEFVEPMRAKIAKEKSDAGN